eukprot:gene4498-5610_t
MASFANFFDKKKKSTKEDNSVSATSTTTTSSSTPISSSNSVSFKDEKKHKDKEEKKREKEEKKKLKKDKEKDTSSSKFNPKFLFSKSSTHSDQNNINSKPIEPLPNGNFQLDQSESTPTSTTTTTNQINNSIDGNVILTEQNNNNNNNNSNTNTNNNIYSITSSASTSSSSLRTSSTNSIQFNSFAKRSESLTSISSIDSSTTSNGGSINSNNSNNTNIMSSSSNGIPIGSQSAKPKSKSKFKNLYNSLKFKSLRSEKVSHHPNSITPTLSKSNFEFLVPASPLPIFDQQFPSILFYSSNQSISPDQSYFGVFLSILIKRQDNGLLIPILIEKCISFLEGYVYIEDLFFKKGNNEKVHQLKMNFERNGDSNFYYPELQDPYDIASLLIEFIASLPEELLNLEFYTAIVNHSTAQNSKYGGYWDIQFQVEQLSVESRELLQRFLYFLNKHVKICLPKSKGILDQLTSLLTPLFINHKSHLLYQPATAALITKCEDFFIQIEDRPETLPGEVIMLQISKVIIPPNDYKIVPSSSDSNFNSSSKDVNNKILDCSQWENGTLYVTNYRIIWKRDESESEQSNFLLPEDSDRKSKKEVEIKPYQFEIILTSAIKWETIGKSKSFKLLNNPILDFGRFFSSVNQEQNIFNSNNNNSNNNSSNNLSSSSTSSTNQPGWDIYSPYIECNRLKLEPKDWKVLELTTRETNTFFPKRILLPTFINEDLINGYIKKTQSKVPVLSWINQNNRAQLYRVCAYHGYINGSVLISSGGNIVGGGLHQSYNGISTSNGMNGANILSSSGGITMNGSTGSQLLDEPPSPIKKRAEKQFSPHTSLRTMAKSSSGSKKKDQSLTKMTTTNLSDCVDIKLFQMFINRDINSESSPLLNGANGSIGSGNGSNTIMSSTSLSNSKIFKRSNETTIVFTNKLDVNFVSVYDQFKLTSSNIVFLNVPTREEIEVLWYELYKSINCFDGSIDSWRSIEESGWIESMRSLIDGCNRITNLLEDGASVLIKPHTDSLHHSLDLARINSLVMILNDPYYRTIQGFITLIEREWIQYGYSFINIQQHKDQSLSSSSSSSSRSKGYGSISKASNMTEDKLGFFEAYHMALPDLPDSMSKKKQPLFTVDSNESINLVIRAISPVFIQFLDAIWQVQRQYPFHFEFNEYLLLFLITESFSGRFGTFLYSESLREPEKKFLKKSPSIWTYITQNQPIFTNLLYKNSQLAKQQPGLSPKQRDSIKNGTTQGNTSSPPGSPKVQPLKQEDFNEIIKPSIEPDQIILWSSFFTQYVNTRESQQISKKLIGKVKCDLIQQKLTFFQIDQSLLPFFSSLTQLNLSKNFLNTFPSDIILLNNLNHLTLSDNRIKSIPSSLLKLIGSKLKLVELNLSGNLLDSLHKSICSISTLQRLILDNNYLSIIPESISKMKYLKTLSVCNNRLTTFPQALSLLVGLEELYVSNNRIRDLPLGFFKLKSIRILDLRWNQIGKFKSHKLDDKVLLMSNIHTFKCGPNPFIKIGTMLFEMKTLKYLELAGCSLSSIPPKLFDLVNLESLYLNQNKLTEVPIEFQKFTQLVVLDLSDNQFSSLPTNAFIPSLKKLYLQNNNIYSFSFNQSALPVIEDLRLDGNRFTYVSPSLGKLVSLTSLNLERNNISVLPHTIASLTKLKFLGVSTANMVSPFKDMDSTDSIMLYLKQLMRQSYYIPRGKLVVISDSNLTSKNEIIRTLVSNKKKISSKNNSSVSVSARDSHQKKVLKWEIELDEYNGNGMMTMATNNTSTSSMNSNISSTTTAIANNNAITNNATVSVTSINGNTGGSNLLKKKNSITTYIRDVPSIIFNCSQHLFTKKAIYLLLWSLIESEEPNKIYRWLELIKDRCSQATIFIVGVYNEKESSVGKDFYTYISAKVEQKCAALFPNFTFSFQLIGTTSESLPKLREDIKTAFIKQKHYGSKVTSSQRLFEKHLKTLQSPYISKRDLYSIGEMCGLDKIGTKNASDLLTELGLLLWVDEYEWVILDPLWLTTAFSSLLTVKHNNLNNVLNDNPPRREIITFHSLETIWSDIPNRLYPYLLILAKKYNLSFVIDKLYDPTPWGYTYNTPISSQPSSPSLRSISSVSSRNSPSKSLSPLRQSMRFTSSSESCSPFSPLKSRPENLKFLNEKVIFLPNELPDHPPSPIDTLIPPYELRVVQRIYEFDSKIPSSFFPRLLSQLYMFCSIRACWKSGVVLDNCHLSFPVARRYPSSPNIKILRRSSTLSVLASDDLVFIQVNENTQSIELSSTKMFRHILQTFESVLESYKDLQHNAFIPCTHCIEAKARPEEIHLFSLEQVESAVTKGKSYISCNQSVSTPIKLNQLAPDLTMNDIRHKLIDFAEVELESEPIGEGGTATVYKGKWRNNIVAVKLLKTDNVGSSFSRVFSEFRREIFCMSSFYHPNILDMKGFCLEPLCIITEFMSGGNLYDYLHNLSNPLDWKLKIKIAKEIASSLQVLHECKPSVIHRDLKSPNILLSSTDSENITSQLCDFSLSGFSTTLHCRAVENPVWLAPEVIANEGCSDKSDVYSFGVILFELLVRKKFFEDVIFMSTVEQLICEGIRPEIPPHDVPEYDILLNSCWNQDPASRPSFTEILKSIEHIETIIEKRNPSVPKTIENEKQQSSNNNNNNHNNQYVPSSSSSPSNINNNHQGFEISSPSNNSNSGDELIDGIINNISSPISMTPMIISSPQISTTPIMSSTPLTPKSQIDT